MSSLLDDTTYDEHDLKRLSKAVLAAQYEFDRRTGGFVALAQSPEEFTERMRFASPDLQLVASEYLADQGETGVEALRRAIRQAWGGSTRTATDVLCPNCGSEEVTMSARPDGTKEGICHDCGFTNTNPSDWDHDVGTLWYPGRDASKKQATRETEKSSDNGIVPDSDQDSSVDSDDGVKLDASNEHCPSCGSTNFNGETGTCGDCNYESRDVHWIPGREASVPEALVKAGSAELYDFAATWLAMHADLTGDTLRFASEDRTEEWQQLRAHLAGRFAISEPTVETELIRTALPMVLAEISTDTCHCGSPMFGSDHCPECGCEQFEATCDHRCPDPGAQSVGDHLNHTGGRHATPGEPTPDPAVGKIFEGRPLTELSGDEPEDGGVTIEDAPDPVDTKDDSNLLSIPEEKTVAEASRTAQDDMVQSGVEAVQDAVDRGELDPADDDAVYEFIAEGNDPNRADAVYSMWRSSRGTQAAKHPQPFGSGNMACPKCGGDDFDYLGRDLDSHHLKCTSCGHEVFPPTETGMSASRTGAGGGWYVIDADTQKVLDGPFDSEGDAREMGNDTGTNDPDVVYYGFDPEGSRPASRRASEDPDEFGDPDAVDAIFDGAPTDNFEGDVDPESRTGDDTDDLDITLPEAPTVQQAARRSGAESIEEHIRTVHGKELPSGKYPQLVGYHDQLHREEDSDHTHEARKIQQASRRAASPPVDGPLYDMADHLEYTHGQTDLSGRGGSGADITGEPSELKALHSYLHSDGAISAGQGATDGHTHASRKAVRKRSNLPDAVGDAFESWCEARGRAPNGGTFDEWASGGGVENVLDTETDAGLPQRPSADELAAEVRQWYAGEDDLRESSRRIADEASSEDSAPANPPGPAPSEESGGGSDALDPWGHPIVQPGDGHSAWSCNNWQCTDHPQELYGGPPEGAGESPEGAKRSGSHHEASGLDQVYQNARELGKTDSPGDGSDPDLSGQSGGGPFINDILREIVQGTGYDEYDDEIQDAQDFILDAYEEGYRTGSRRRADSPKPGFYIGEDGREHSHFGDHFMGHHEVQRNPDCPQCQNIQRKIDNGIPLSTAPGRSSKVRSASRRLAGVDWDCFGSGDCEYESPNNGPTAQVTQDEIEGPDTWSAYVWPSGDATEYSEKGGFQDTESAKSWAESKMQLQGGGPAVHGGRRIATSNTCPNCGQSAMLRNQRDGSWDCMECQQHYDSDDALDQAQADYLGANDSTAAPYGYGGPRYQLRGSRKVRNSERTGKVNRRQAVSRGQDKSDDGNHTVEAPNYADELSRIVERMRSDQTTFQDKENRKPDTTSENPGATGFATSGRRDGITARVSSRDGRVVGARVVLQKPGRPPVLGKVVAHGATKFHVEWTDGKRTLESKADWRFVSRSRRPFVSRGRPVRPRRAADDKSVAEKGVQAINDAEARGELDSMEDDELMDWLRKNYSPQDAKVIYDEYHSDDDLYDDDDG